MIPNWLHKAAQGKTVAIALVIWIVGGAAIFNLGPYRELGARAPEVTILDERFAYDPFEAHEALTALGQEGREVYGRFLLWDVAFAILLTGALTLAVTYVLKRLGWHRTLPIAAALPSVVGVLDLTENAAILRLLARYPERVDGWARMAATATTGKLVIASGLFAGLLLALLVLGVLAIRKKDRYAAGS